MIEVKNITKKFNSLTAVNDISLTIKKGEIVGLLGPNGAGKTTTLRMIAGIFPPSKGSVFIDDQDLSKNNKIKKNIGYLPEDNPLYEEMTVEEFLKFWAEIKGISKDELQEALKFVIKRTNIKSVYYRPIAELSKGYRQRVGLSQAILTKPDILILDEPTEGLDPNQRKEIKSLIKELGKNRTVIIASHVLSEISQIAQRMIIINKGKIVKDDTVERLKQAKSGIDLIEVEIKGKAVMSKLGSLKGILKVEKLSSNKYLLEAENKKDIRSDIFNLAKENNWTVLGMVKKEQELEDVFSKLTKD